MIGSPAAISGLGMPAAQANRAQGDAVFADLLRKAERGASEDEVRGAAEDLVANAFLVPILRQIRETSDAAPPFQPTPAEKQFGQMLDAKTAKQIVRKSDLPIVDRLTATFRELGSSRSEGVLA